ncbi:hypothetical protein POM88_010325 [Heracleum sosnowskyi]|uniref:Uncharacterized protein n=1 Tax=Heracleum sosnowskyi TaxID=360622 RepID=A0AAD8ISD1_9APIA|nr:hypothetical protein POM88_010325 [Heracleum sosnowskyi]
MARASLFQTGCIFREDNLSPDIASIVLDDLSELETLWSGTLPLVSLKTINAELVRNGSNFKVNLKDSFLQVRDVPSFKADLPNTEVPEWFTGYGTGLGMVFRIELGHVAVVVGRVQVSWELGHSGKLNWKKFE